MSNEKEYIKFHHYKKYLTCQPFFIWHKLEDIDKYEIEDNSSVNWWSEHSFSFDSDSFEKDDSENFGAISAKTFSILDNHLKSQLTKEYKTEIISGTIEQKIELTKTFLNSNKLLLNPVFEYNGAIATPIAFDTKTKTIIVNKHSKKTKRDDLILAVYNYSIISKNTTVKGYEIFLPEDKFYRKGEISLHRINRVMPMKTGDLPFALNAKGEFKDIDIMTFVQNPQSTNKRIPTFEDFDYSLEKIKAAKDKTKVEFSYILDNTIFGTNKQWNELLEYHKHPYSGFNGNVIRKNDIVTGALSESKVLDLYEEINKTIIVKENKEITEAFIKNIRKQKRIVWYDYEGFSLPISPIDGFGPYEQVVFQVSVIQTINNKEDNINNLVVDPLTINHDDFYKIIKAVYSNHADAYIVYNKNYENTRNREIVDTLKMFNHPKAAEVEKMVKHINDNTIDLADLFIINSRNKLPLILLNDQKLRYSIKNIEKHITMNNIPLKRLITPYKNLDVKNGGMAMQIAIERALNIIGDNKWITKTTQLKKYCENDVRAMIMVYDFIEYLIQEKGK